MASIWKDRAECQVPFARPLMFFIIFGGRLPQFATAIWTAGPRNGSQRLARLEFRAGSGRRKGWGVRNVRGVPLPCVTTVSTTSNLGLPRSVTSLRQSTSTPVHEDLPRQKIPQRRYAFFQEQSLLFPRK